MMTAMPKNNTKPLRPNSTPPMTISRAVNAANRIVVFMVLPIVRVSVYECDQNVLERHMSLVRSIYASMASLARFRSRSTWITGGASETMMITATMYSRYRSEEHTSELQS